MVTSLDAKKKRPFTKSNTLHNKRLGETRDKRDILKHNKGNVQQAHSQHPKLRETQSSWIKIRNKTRLSTLAISSQYST